MQDDPTITRIRMARSKISEKYQNNASLLIAHYRELEQKRFSKRMIFMNLYDHKEEINHADKESS